MLPIRQIINALSGLNRTHKAVVIEVVELAEHGGKGYCNATNSYLAARLRATERTISRALADLIRWRLLQTGGAGKARRLTAAPALRACFENGENKAAMEALNLDNRTPANLDKTPRQPRQNGEVEATGAGTNLDKQGHQPRQTGSPNLDKRGHQPGQTGSRVYGDDQDDQLTTKDEQEIATLRAALCQREQELVEARQRIAQLEATQAPAPAPKPTKKRVAHGAVDLPEPWATLLTTEAAKVQRLQEPLTADQLTRLLATYTDAAVREVLVAMDNYKKLLTSYESAYKTAGNWLKRRAEDGKLVLRGAHTSTTQATGSLSERLVRQQTKVIE